MSTPRGARRATRRAPSPCLLNYPSGLRGRGARRGVQEAVAPPVNAWLSGALFRLRIGVRRTQRRSVKLLVSIPQTGTHWDKRGRGKAGVHIFDGAWGRKCSTWMLASELTFLPRPRCPGVTNRSERDSVESSNARSEFSLDRLRKRYVVLKDTRSNYLLSDALI